MDLLTKVVIFATLSMLAPEIYCFTHTMMKPSMYHPAGGPMPGAAAASTRLAGWSNAAIPMQPVPVPMQPVRGYQQPPPPIPYSYYGRYIDDGYYDPTSMENNDYYYPPAQDTYPYAAAPSYDSQDYYPNVLYFMPSNQQYLRSVPYPYDPSVLESLAEHRDNIYGQQNNDQNAISKQRKVWWLNQNEPHSLNEDFEEDEDVEEEEIDTPAKPTRKIAEVRPFYDRRFDGIDGFGRKKEKERTFGVRKQNSGRHDVRTWVYGVPVEPPQPYVAAKKGDETVQQLKSLMTVAMTTTTKKPTEEKIKPASYPNNHLADWIAGNKKRNIPVNKRVVTNDNDTTENTPIAEETEEERAFTPATASIDGDQDEISSSAIRMFPDGTQENDYMSLDTAYKHSSEDNQRYEYDGNSVFDTIRKLLAMEDKVNRQDEAEAERNEGTNKMSNFYGQPQKRSIITSEETLGLPAAGKRFFVPNEKTLADELNALRLHSTQY